MHTLFGWSRAPGARAGAGSAWGLGCGLEPGPRVPGHRGGGGGGGRAGSRQGAGWGGGEGKAPRVLPEERRRREQREGGESGRACHVPSLTLGASCTTSPRKSTGKWQTGLTGFTRSSLDRAAHYHNRLQRRRRGAPVAAAGPARTLARGSPAATADPAAGRDPRDCAPAAGLARSPSGQGAAGALRPPPPADPAVRAGLAVGGGGGRAEADPPASACQDRHPRGLPRSSGHRGSAGVTGGFRAGRSGNACGQGAAGRGGGVGLSRDRSAPRRLSLGGNRRLPAAPAAARARRTESRGRWRRPPGRDLSVLGGCLFPYPRGQGPVGGMPPGLDAAAPGRWGGRGWRMSGARVY